ncbi:hypothetical protein [Cohaesibacter haloalkalitolerans]|uniref:hypothetical protein n=1 Tax=Cohaesibacter haloalkalitolerans TaxID=1162980 RepID=UPI000E65526C|nr:hypothetical protein [Cohaesibacter haloalkalitolerans]
MDELNEGSETLSSLGDKIAQVSDIYAERFAIERDDLWHLCKLSEELGELHSAFLSLSGRGRDRGKSKAELEQAVEQELADLFAHLLLFAKHRNINIEQALQTKWFRYLSSKPE